MIKIILSEREPLPSVLATFPDAIGAGGGETPHMGHLMPICQMADVYIGVLHTPNAEVILFA